MPKKPNLHLCIDRVIPLHLKGKAMDIAVKENPKNKPPSLFPLLPGASNGRAKMALVAGKMWANGRTLHIAFLDGNDIQKRKVTQNALLWCKYANINLDFSGGSGAEIRISFEADPGSWSAIGTDCLHTEYFKPTEPTMNFGWLKANTDDVEYRRVVVHEFGHALGCIHEHQNPRGGIRWNTQAVYAYFSGPPNNWSKQDIDVNIIDKYSVAQLNASKFDRNSIMLYAFPPELVVGGVGTPENTELSTGDKRYITRMYPKRK